MPSSSKVLDEARELVTKRLAELDTERKRLERALAELSGKATEHRGPSRRRHAAAKGDAPGKRRRRKGGRVEQTVKLAQISATMAIVLLGSAAEARSGSGSLDQGFGRHGRVTRAIRPLSSVSLPFTAFAAAPSGKVVVEMGQTLLRYGRSGRLDRSFGSGGRVTVEAPAGTQFEPAALVVDKWGRVLVAGTTTPFPSRYMPDPYPSAQVSSSMVTIFRFTRRGKLDASFATGGIASTNLGLKPPFRREANGAEFHYEAPVVSVTGLTVDDEGRPVPTGTAVNEIGACHDDLPPGSRRFTEGFVARLSVNGVPDASFGEGGVRADANLGNVDEPFVDPAAGVVYDGRLALRCLHPLEPETPIIGHLGSEGAPDPAFGPGGWRALRPIPVERTGGFYFAHKFAVDSLGRIFLLEQGTNGIRVAKLLPSGATDPRFGRGGNAYVRTSKLTYIDAIGTDSRGRVLLAGSHWRRRCFGCNPERDRGPISTFYLLRLRSDGSVDRRFGGRGSVQTGFPGFGHRTKASAGQVLFDSRGHILLGGTIDSRHFRTGAGFGLTRYLP